MSADQPHPSVQVYQLKVGLRDCSTMIWRRLLVTSDTTIAQLPTILQIAMGWEDLHLHRVSLPVRKCKGPMRGEFECLIHC
jgi:hypothetical protein